MQEIPEALERHIKSLSDHFENEDTAVRQRQIRQWRKMKLYWAGFTRIWFSETAHNWQIWDQSIETEDNQASYYDKPINLFRAYLESIIAALSINIPVVHCTPDDAENPDDINTAEAGNNIYLMVSKYINSQLLFIQALYVLCTEGMVAAYTYSKEDEKYGTYEDKKYEDMEVEARQCAVCGMVLSDELFAEAGLEQPQEEIEDFDSSELDEFAPDDDDVHLHALLNKQEIVCPQCSSLLDPSLEKQKLIIPRLTGITKKPKSRQCFEVYGGLYVKVPNYAKEQKDIPYLRFSYETHYANAIARFEKLQGMAKKDVQLKREGSSGIYDPYERWGRLSPQYYGEYPTNNVTVRMYWFRPESYWVLEEDNVKELKNKYPDGLKAIFVNDILCELHNENLDDCWTITKNPLSDYIHYDPLGLLLTSVQDITNDLIALTLQTIEQGIPQTFADPAVLDFEAYRNSEATPGGVYPTKAQGATKNIAEGFTTLKTASLSPEVMPFGASIQSMGQLASGALPSLFGGGGSEQGSKTASEYAMSRAQALQRLQTPWKMLTLWWKDSWSKIIDSYIKDAVDDEHFTKKDYQGNFLKVYIKKAQLEGKIGSVELEGSEQIPSTWQQKKDALMQLLQMNNPQILEALMSPENLSLLKEALGLQDFVMPGEDYRIKQFEEIRQLLDSEPLPDGSPSVPIDVELDDHALEAEVVKSWAVSEAGRLAKIENPSGYMNVLAHGKEHIMQVQLMQAQEMAAAAGQNEKPKKGQQIKGDNQNELRLPVGQKSN